MPQPVPNFVIEALYVADGRENRSSSVLPHLSSWPVISLRCDANSTELRRHVTCATKAYVACLSKFAKPWRGTNWRLNMRLNIDRSPLWVVPVECSLETDPTALTATVQVVAELIGLLLGLRYPDETSTSIEPNEYVWQDSLSQLSLHALCVVRGSGFGGGLSLVELAVECWIEGVLSTRLLEALLQRWSALASHCLGDTPVSRLTAARPLRNDKRGPLEFAKSAVAPLAQRIVVRLLSLLDLRRQPKCDEERSAHLFETAKRELERLPCGTTHCILGWLYSNSSVTGHGVTVGEWLLAECRYQAARWCLDGLRHEERLTVIAQWIPSRFADLFCSQHQGSAEPHEQLTLLLDTSPQGPVHVECVWNAIVHSEADLLPAVLAQRGLPWLHHRCCGLQLVHFAAKMFRADVTRRLIEIDDSLAASPVEVGLVAPERVQRLATQARRPWKRIIAPTSLPATQLLSHRKCHSRLAATSRADVDFVVRKTLSRQAVLSVAELPNASDVFDDLLQALLAHERISDVEQLLESLVTAQPHLRLSALSTVAALCARHMTNEDHLRRLLSVVCSGSMARTLLVSASCDALDSTDCLALVACRAHNASAMLAIRQEVQRCGCESSFWTDSELRETLRRMVDTMLCEVATGATPTSEHLQQVVDMAPWPGDELRRSILLLRVATVGSTPAAVEWWPARRDDWIDVALGNSDRWQRTQQHDVSLRESLGFDPYFALLTRAKLRCCRCDHEWTGYILVEEVARVADAIDTADAWDCAVSFLVQFCRSGFELPLWSHAQRWIVGALAAMEKHLPSPAYRCALERLVRDPSRAQPVCRLFEARSFFGDRWEQAIIDTARQWRSRGNLEEPNYSVPVLRCGAATIACALPWIFMCTLLPPEKLHQVLPQVLLWILRLPTGKPETQRFCAAVVESVHRACSCLVVFASLCKALENATASLAHPVANGLHPVAASTVKLLIASCVSRAVSMEAQHCDDERDACAAALSRVLRFAESIAMFHGSSTGDVLPVAQVVIAIDALAEGLSGSVHCFMPRHRYTALAMLTQLAVELHDGFKQWARPLSLASRGLCRFQSVLREWTCQVTRLLLSSDAHHAAPLTEASADEKCTVGESLATLLMLGACTVESVMNAAAESESRDVFVAEVLPVVWLRVFSVCHVTSYSPFPIDLQLLEELARHPSVALPSQRALIAALRRQSHHCEAARRLPRQFASETLVPLLREKWATTSTADALLLEVRTLKGHPLRRNYYFNTFPDSITQPDSHDATDCRAVVMDAIAPKHIMRGCQQSSSSCSAAARCYDIFRRTAAARTIPADWMPHDLVAELALSAPPTADREGQCNAYGAACDEFYFLTTRCLSWIHNAPSTLQRYACAQMLRGVAQVLCNTPSAMVASRIAALVVALHQFETPCMMNLVAKWFSGSLCAADLEGASSVVSSAIAFDVDQLSHLLWGTTSYARAYVNECQAEGIRSAHQHHMLLVAEARCTLADALGVDLAHFFEPSIQSASEWWASLVFTVCTIASNPLFECGDRPLVALFETVIRRTPSVASMLVDMLFSKRGTLGLGACGVRLLLMPVLLQRVHSQDTKWSMWLEETKAQASRIVEFFAPCDLQLCPTFSPPWSPSVMLCVAEVLEVPALASVVHAMCWNRSALNSTLKYSAELTQACALHTLLVYGVGDTTAQADLLEDFKVIHRGEQHYRLSAAQLSLMSMHRASDTDSDVLRSAIAEQLTVGCPQQRVVVAAGGVDVDPTVTLADIAHLSMPPAVSFLLTFSTSVAKLFGDSQAALDAAPFLREAPRVVSKLLKGCCVQVVVRNGIGHWTFADHHGESLLLTVFINEEPASFFGLTPNHLPEPFLLLLLHANSDAQPFTCEGYARYTNETHLAIPTPLKRTEEARFVKQFGDRFLRNPRATTVMLLRALSKFALDLPDQRSGRSDEDKLNIRRRPVDDFINSMIDAGLPETTMQLLNGMLQAHFTKLVENATEADALLSRQSSVSDDNTCCVCLTSSLFDEPVVLQCYHMVCLTCLKLLLEKKMRKCPLCKAFTLEAPKVQIHAPLPPTDTSAEAVAEEVNVEDRWGRHHCSLLAQLCRAIIEDASTMATWFPSTEGNTRVVFHVIFRDMRVRQAFSIQLRQQLCAALPRWARVRCVSSLFSTSCSDWLPLLQMIASPLTRRQPHLNYFYIVGNPVNPTPRPTIGPVWSPDRWRSVYTVAPPSLMRDEVTTRMGSDWGYYRESEPEMMRRLGMHRNDRDVGGRRPYFCF